MNKDIISVGLHMSKDRIDELSLFLSEIGRESDRGMVLIGVSSIDDRLRSILDAFMCPSRHSVNLLSGSNAALGTLSSRNAACLALGLIEQQEFEEINILRKVRNEFAHGLVHISFSNERILALCNSLKSPLPDSMPKERESARLKFSNALASIMIRILFRSEWVALERRRIRQWVDPELLRWRKITNEPPPAGELAVTFTSGRFKVQITEATQKPADDDLPN